MHVDRGREGAILVFLAVFGVLLAVFAPGFFNARNFADILINISTVTIAAVGMTAVILTGQIDISIGAQLAAIATTMGLLGKADVPLPLAFAAGILLGMAFGLVNGILVAYARIPSIVVTLGTMTILRATMLVLTGGSWTVLSPEFRTLGAGMLLGIPNHIVFMLVVLLLGNWVLSHTPWGRSLYAVGSNPSAARLAGINLERTLMSVFVFQGAMIGLTAIAFTTRFTTIEPAAGQGFEFVVITAVVLGGTNVFGGSGTVIGSFMGALLIGVINTSLTFLRVSVYWEQTVQGLLILMAIGLDMFQRRSGMSLQTFKASFRRMPK